MPRSDVFFLTLPSSGVFKTERSKEIRSLGHRFGVKATAESFASSAVSFVVFTAINLHRRHFELSWEDKK